jgi:hypothetical protein
VNPLKKLASHLPASWQQEMKRLQYRGQIRLGTFSTSEPEFVFVEQLIAAGDWVIDIGANVGHCTKKFSTSWAEGRVRRRARARYLRCLPPTSRLSGIAT